MISKIFREGFFRSYLLILFTVLLVLGWSSFAWPSSWEPQAVIKKYLKDHYPWAEIELLDISGEVSSPVPPQKIFMINGPLGRSTFSLVFKSGEKAVIQANVRALDWVVASQRPMKKTQLVEKDDIYLALMDIQKMPKDALTRLDSAWGKIMTQSKAANMVIVESDLGNLPLVKKGQRVTLVVSAPGLKITTPGEARQNGFPGQRFKVINLSSKRDVLGVPLDENHVSVEF